MLFVFKNKNGDQNLSEIRNIGQCKHETPISIVWLFFDSCYFFRSTLSFYPKKNMGYCPYTCVVCRETTDNGWNNGRSWRAILKKFNMKEPNREEVEGCFDVCDYCITAEFPPGTQFCCAVCQKRVAHKWGNQNISHIVASRYGLRYILDEKVVLDVCPRCLWLQPSMNKKQRSLFWSKKIKAVILHKNFY